MLLVITAIFILFFAPLWLTFLLAVGVAIFLLRADADLCTLIAHQMMIQKKKSPISYPQQFVGKTVLVTGASSGLGEYLCYELAKQGAKLVLCARRETELQRVRQGCANSDKHVTVVLDLSDTDSHKKIAADAIEKAGGRIDVCVQNAGRSARGLVEDVLLKVDQDQLHLNTIGTISLTKAFLPHFIKNQGGHFVVVSSVAGKLGAPSSANYSASKAALMNYFSALRIETVDQGLHVTLVCPGPVASEGANNAITATGGTAKDEGCPTSSYDKRRMPTKRFAELMAAAMHAKLHETWISPHPELLYTYLAQYSPLFYSFLSTKLGPGRVRQFRAAQKKGS
uniref:Ketoreductase domain-containing protein n=1 Tax=Chromera velia CCMP2878 TaxID=1169474 RepID=A0A0G4HI01_9ALVE|mmetsp:Transcript_48018/g.94829  ORF Transcript_48018/g.94829 Transcript_48018/m.94829 type:complete len:340 (+) Transcript_48018:188-1207(+)|eukprot:Cvel_6884.t1-p1 / transcript=Cvel_6884.t1 / gene=Cvel_6884 / organism=Chromera_velia_CCMP2878 / gene_product=Dehydrogenase/reductase SDR family member 7, putative / transcript_product=Dehydrogenase/reductase SDR family member 7, putative / location=Cvel_scaffold348:35476-36492(+) / protein_length=339 / sequence_SO=supercontig / SO=protein_coding / is_pseudo=false